jgi:hypothetical protein
MGASWSTKARFLRPVFAGQRDFSTQNNRKSPSEELSVSARPHLRTCKCQSSLFTQRFTVFAQQIGDVSPTAHVQLLRDLFQTHRGFLPQLHQPYLVFIPLGRWCN